MNDKADTARVMVRPPLALALSIVVGLALDWLAPLPFMPAGMAKGWLGGALIALALSLATWAIVAMTRAGSNVPTNRPTTAMIESGPYAFTRNPIYVGMFLLLSGLAIAFDTLWLLAALVPFALIIRNGVVVREEAYLDRKFGETYRRYRTRVRRWL